MTHRFRGCIVAAIPARGRRPARAAFFAECRDIDPHCIGRAVRDCCTCDYWTRDAEGFMRREMGPWLRICGTEYDERRFRAKRAADPRVRYEPGGQLSFDLEPVTVHVTLADIPA